MSQLLKWYFYFHNHCLPGLQYVPFRMLPTFKLAVVLVVRFEKVPNGMRVGVSIFKHYFQDFVLISAKLLSKSTYFLPDCYFAVKQWKNFVIIYSS